MTSRIYKLALATIVVLPLLLVEGAAAGDPSHLYCLANTDRLTPNLKATADLFPLQSPPFEFQNCRIRLRSGNVCVPADKVNVRTRDGEPVETFPIADSGAQAQLCYQLRCPPEGPRGTGLKLEVEDQLGRRTIEIRRADYFCQPAVVTSRPF